MSNTVSVEAFTQQAREFLEHNAERKEAAKAFVWGEGSDNVAMFEERSREAEMEVLRKAKEWQAKRFDNGFGWITGPTQYGGAGLTPAHERAYNAVERDYRTPSLGMFQIGLGMVAPTILAHATDRAKDLYLRAMWRSDIVGEWVITGQKVWTSGAQFSDIGEIICRTDVSLPKHKGLTGFIVDMHAPGVEIRPLRQMTGGASFNEVFFNEVRVPDDHRLGDVNNGWNVALTTLMNERASIGTMGGGETSMWTRLLAMIRHYGMDSDPIVREMLADLYINTKIQGYTGQRAMDKIRAGQTPGPEMSIGKMALVDNQKRMNDLVSHVLGAKLQADTGEWGTYAWSHLLLGAPGMRIAGGSDEVMRNIVSERVLGLPKDAGIDSKSAFKDLKVGTQKD
ncbi:MAG: acyl-CoA dehydrogenase [Actinobacteria bacterium]|nr:acyl-CoA dehydrogenase [Actinomycetota bacterium]